MKATQPPALSTISLDQYDGFSVILQTFLDANGYATAAAAAQALKGWTL